MISRGITDEEEIEDRLSQVSQAPAPSCSHDDQAENDMKVVDQEQGR